MPTPEDRPSTEESETTTDQPSIEDIMCNTDIDAIASIRNEIFVFKNKVHFFVFEFYFQKIIFIIVLVILVGEK